MSEPDPTQTIPGMEEDDFAQTRGADDLFESEIQPTAPPPTAPREPRAFRRPQQPAAGAGGASAPPAAGPPVEDRQLSGGVRKPKLTEEELAARMERVKINNARLTERARRAVEDETSFQVLEEQRQAEDTVKRAGERKKKIEAEKNQRELDEERERNRQRKLKAVQNREWDSQKTEDDYNDRRGGRGGGSRFRRGAHGGVAGPPRSINVDTTPATVVAKPAAEEEQQEWPDLPGAKEESTEEKEKKVMAELPSMSPGIGSWADQVEMGSPATPTAPGGQ